MNLVLNDITMTLKNIAENVTEEELRENIYHDLNMWTYYAVDVRTSIIQTGHALCHDKFRHAKSTTLSEMQVFCHEYFKQMKIVALIQGNLSETAAKSIMQMVETNLGCGKIEDVSVLWKILPDIAHLKNFTFQIKSIELHALKLPLGVNHLILRPFEKSQSGSDTVNYYQIGPKSHRSKAMIDLLEDISHDPLEENEESLEYQLSWRSTEDCGILGYNIYCNSDEQKYPAPFGVKRINEFHDEFATFIENMPVEEFQKHVSAVIKNKLLDFSCVAIEVEFQNWPEIESGEYCFDRHLQEIEILLNLTQSELLQFYRYHSGANERKLSIQCIGYTEATGLTEWREGEPLKHPENAIYVDSGVKDSGTLVKDIGKFKRSLELFD